MSKCVVPFSGGMDSTTILFHALHTHDEIFAVSIDYGQRHLKKELEAARSILFSVSPAVSTVKPWPKTHHKILNLGFFREISNVSALTNDNIDVALAKDVMGDPQTVNYVPFRNMMILSICSAFAETVGADVVYHGAAQADSVAGFWDGSQEFINAINNVNVLNRRNKIKIVAPLIDKSKAEIIEWGTSLGVDYSRTWTCYKGEDKACGECTSCSLRLKGFIDAGIKDPLPYSKEIDWSKLLKTA